METKQEKLPFDVIALAVSGNVVAINKVLKHFEPYINKLSQRTLFDEMSNPHIVIDPEIKRTIETKLIVSIVNDFELAL